MEQHLKKHHKQEPLQEMVKVACCGQFVFEKEEKYHAWLCGVPPKERSLAYWHLLEPTFKPVPMMVHTRPQLKPRK